MRKIEKLNFGIMNPEKARKLSVKRIDKAEVYDADGYPVEGGVMDPHLGVLDPGMVCPTDGGRMRETQGHFGHIELSKPVINVLYTKKIRNLLRFTNVHDDGSVSCLLKDEDKSLRKSNRMTTDPETGEEVPDVTLEKPYSFYQGDEQLDPQEIKERLSQIPDEMAAKLGVSGGRPEWLVMDIVLVPPVNIRPSITLESGQRSEDDLTHKLVDVIRINQRLRNNIEIDAPDFIIDDLWELLQYHVATMFDNDLTGVPPARHRSGRSLKSLIERLKGKEGRFRQNLIGKRANFSARTVISPDPNIDIDEVGVPREIATQLTIPVKVKEDNIEQVRDWIRNGEDHPGVNYIFRQDGSRKKVTDETVDEILDELAPGYKVERHLMDGDVVLFNRQPSLHRNSIMAHKVRVMPYRTFRLNLAVCPPYNADFDGDEMNLHIPQTEEARAEAEELLAVKNHIKSAKFGGPIVGMMQDHVSGLFLLSRDEAIPRKQAFDLLVSAGATDKDLPEGETVTGKELISLFIPDDITIETEDTVIRNGEVVEGVIDEDMVSDYGGEIINQLMLHHDEDTTAEFINKVTKLGAMYLDRRGFSISTTDLEVSDAARQEIEDRITEGKEDAEELLDQYEAGEIEPLTGKTVEETLEVKLVSALREISTEVEQIVDEDVPMTSARVMAESGARGSMTNLAVMSGLLGQETVRGERISRGFKNRSLPHFRPEDRSPRARGFVRSSIFSGLEPDEMFFEVMSGREGLMDQSLRTRTSGYMYRRISNALQDLKVEYDRSVRSADGTVVQFTAGEDGVDPQKSDRGEIISQ